LRRAFGTLDEDKVYGGIRRNDLWQLHKGSGGIQKRDRWRGGEGGDKMGNDAKVPERKDAAGKTLQYVSEDEKPRGD
jgi:hypothetical protein